MNSILQEVFQLCLENKNVSCVLNHETIKVYVNTGYKVLIFESWHQPDMAKVNLRTLGYTQLDELVSKITYELS